MRSAWRTVASLLAILGSSVLFLVPFAFIITTALKDKPEAALLRFTWPNTLHAWENLVQVVQARDYMLLLAFFNIAITSMMERVLVEGGRATGVVTCTETCMPLSAYC